ncbi:uncharacterized protein LOC114543241 [Dendronephthya gigantea]|uniref:uncharacterized protein LOC114543241 n=1 Tax=Dendronephthya gigantea TaxID=151771 RepID=UPI00106B8E2F|nr:uncharacterized protein LOC114543241 [Dendronephthya gigantea]
MDHDNFINQNGEQLIENMEDPTRSAALYILKLQEECSLPKSTVAGIVSNTKTILQETLAHVQTQVQGCLSNANIDDQNVPGLREIFKDNITTNPFHNLETEAQQFAYYKAHFGLKEPQRIVLGRREVFKRRKGIMQQTQVNDEAYYIPLLDSLQQLLNDEFILEEIKNPHVSIDGLMRDYCDGYQFKMHPLFSVKPTALQIMLYYDDLETCNPLGSRATIHKLGAFYYTLGNINPLNRSSMKAIQLLCLCKTSNIKQYGINAVLGPFMADLKKLEQDTGHPFTVQGTEQNFCGSIVYTSADNLGAQQLGGFKESCSAHRPCRYCLATAEEMKSKFHEKDFVLRTKEDYKDQINQVETYGEHFSKTYGLNRRSILNESDYYHVIGGLPPDIMHDILEGVLQYETKEMLKHYIKVERYLTLEILNDRIAKYDFGYYNDSNRPSPITEQKLSSNDNNLKQHGKFKS